jgi:hypothetical protein
MRRASRMTSAVSFAVVLFLSLACYTSDRMSGCAMGRMPWKKGEILNWTLLRYNIAFPLSLSLTYIRFKRQGVAGKIRKSSILAYALYKLYITRSNSVETKKDLQVVCLF